MDVMSVFRLQKLQRNFYLLSLSNFQFLEFSLCKFLTEINMHEHE